MSWFILDEACVNSPSLLVLEVESLEGHFSAGEPSAPSSSQTTPEECFLLVSEMGSSRVFQCGTTFAPSMANPGGGGWTSSPEDSLARTSPLLEREQESRESDPAYGRRWLELLAKWDPDTSSWRTAQCSLLGDLELFSGTWPRSGTMRNGSCWERTMPALLTSVTESGFWPTPLATDASHGGPNQRDSSGRPGLTMAAHLWPTPAARDYKAPNSKPYSERGGGEEGGAIAQRSEVLADTGRKHGSQGNSTGVGTEAQERTTGAVHDQPSGEGFVCHSSSTGLSDRLDGQVGQPGQVEEPKRPDWWAVEPAIRGVVDGLAPGLDQFGTAPGTYLGRVARGVPARADRLKAIGNGQCPAQLVLAVNILGGSQ
jgi:hypothetical protein